jgi:hypothetical protein
MISDPMASYADALVKSFGKNPHQVIFAMLRDSIAKSQPRYTKGVDDIESERTKESRRII